MPDRGGDGSGSGFTLEGHFKHDDSRGYNKDSLVRFDRGSSHGLMASKGQISDLDR